MRSKDELIADSKKFINQNGLGVEILLDIRELLIKTTTDGTDDNATPVTIKVKPKQKRKYIRRKK